MAIPSPHDVPPPPPSTPNDDPPPRVFGSWRNVYLCVVAYLAVLIVLFYSFRVTFER